MSPNSSSPSSTQPAPRVNSSPQPPPTPVQSTATTQSMNERGGQDSIMASALALILDEMRDFRQLTKQMVAEQQNMRLEIAALRKDIEHQSKNQQHMKELLTSMAKRKEEPTRHHQQQTTRPRPAWTPGPALLAPFPDSTTRLDVLNYFPFLSEYPITNHALPFVVDDLRKPICAFYSLPSSLRAGDNLPIIAFANEAFCGLIKYSLVSAELCKIYVSLHFSSLHAMDWMKALCSPNYYASFRTR